MVQTRMENTKFSQNDEELYILQHFNNHIGKFLDIGAFAPDTFSNTRALADRGWNGVLIEPSPAPFIALLKHYGSNPNIRLLNAAVTLTGGFSDFYDSGGDAISSTLESHAKKWATGYGTKFTAYDVYTVPLTDLFDRYGFDFDFINVDVEGASYPLFAALPFSRLAKTTCICMEHDGNIQTAIKLASEHGYRMVASNGENLIFVR